MEGERWAGQKESRELQEGIKKTLHGLEKKRANASLGMYQEVQKLYEQGSPPSKEELVGWFSGICYSAAEEGSYRSQPALWVGWKLPYADKNNPGADVFAVIPLAFSSKTSGGAIPRALLDDPDHPIDIGKESYRIPPLVEKDGALVTSYEAFTGPPIYWVNAEFRFRKAAGGLVEKGILLQDIPPLKAGDTAEYCLLEKSFDW